MSAPLIYARISAVTAKLSKRGIAKLRDNGEYHYRGIDDIYAGLAPLLAKHQICILPRVIERYCSERTSSSGHAVFQVALKVAFDLVAVDDGSIHTIEIYGEAVDEGDKATAKALSMAYKYAAIQTFCIPVGGQDIEASVPRVRATTVAGDVPVQGWDQWIADITDLIRGCETADALTRVQQTYRRELRLLASGDKVKFDLIGAAFQDRRDALSRSRDKAIAAPSAQSQAISAPALPRETLRDPRVEKAVNATA